MNDELALTTLAALAQTTRLGVFRLLIRHEPDGLPAGDIARALGAAQNTLSTHLSVLTRAGLATAERQGRHIIYRAVAPQLHRLFEFLMKDCCGGRALCPPPNAEP